MKPQPIRHLQTSEANSFAGHGFIATQMKLRLQDVVEVRKIGPLSLIEIAQSAGSYPDDAAPEFNLQTLISGNCAAQISYGGLRVDWAPARIGDTGLAPANTHCTYDLAGDHAILAIPLPSNLVREVANDVMPSFNGDFGWLHSKSFRVEAVVRKQMHNLWHAAAGNSNHLNVDAHAIKQHLFCKFRFWFWGCCAIASGQGFMFR